MEAYFCDRCSCRITEGELAEHKAFAFGTLKFCETCWQSEQVQAVVRRNTGLMAAVCEGGAGASAHEHAGRAKSATAATSPPKPVSAVSAPAGRRHRRHPSPGRLGPLAEAQGGLAVAWHVRRPSGTADLKRIVVVFGVAALITFLVLSVVILFVSFTRVSRATPDRRPAAVRVAEGHAVGDTRAVGCAARA